MKTYTDTSEKGLEELIVRAFVAEGGYETGSNADFASAEAAIRKQIALLPELRTRLVSGAVTGTVEI